MKHFKAPIESFGHLDTKAASTLIAAASELTLIVDNDGTIIDVVCNDDSIAGAGCKNWIGRSWIETVTTETRGKIESLIKDAVEGEPSRPRQVNHPAPSGPDIPVLYSTIRIASTNRIMAIGRNLGIMASLQQSLLEAQQSMEREYARLRHAEGRYRLLFQTAPDAILVVTAASKKVVEANPAAAQIFGTTAAQLIGQAVGEAFDADSARLLEIAFARLQATGRTDEVRLRLKNNRREFVASATMFRQDNTSMYLIRLDSVSNESNISVLPSPKSKLLKLIEHSTDGFVVTDFGGRVLMANAAFLEFAQINSEEQARAESLDRWLGRSGIDLNLLIGSLRQHGSVRLFATTLRGEQGASTDVEISAVSILNGGQPYFGFTIRDVERRLVVPAKHGKPGANAMIPRSLEQLAELVGRVSLKELVRESTDVIERMCIEAALELTGDNRASAAELLGVSRQSLYMKLRRYGLGDLAEADDEKPE